MTYRDRILDDDLYEDGIMGYTSSEWFDVNPVFGVELFQTQEDERPVNGQV